MQSFGGQWTKDYRAPDSTEEPRPEGQRINMVTAIRRTLDRELEINPRMLLFGEDIGPKGGVHAVTLGLQDKYGIERVFDMVMVVVFFAVNLVFFEYIARDADASRLFGWIKVTGVFLLFVAAAGIYGLSAFRRGRNGALTYLEKKLSWLPKRAHAATISLLRHISEGLAVLHDARA